MQKLPRLTAKEIIRALNKAGFYSISQKDSHIKLKNNSRRIIVPFHKGKIIPPKTFKGIIKDSGLTLEEFVNLL
jgi:predicted RNA binding protein YcfA (HicA-like mRNA interferase family)